MVKLDETKTVVALQDAIKSDDPKGLAHIGSHQLTLYRVDVDGSDEQEYIESVKKIAQELHKHTELNPLSKLSDVFENLAPLEMTIHILVKLP